MNIERTARSYAERQANAERIRERTRQLQQGAPAPREHVAAGHEPVQVTGSPAVPGAAEGAVALRGSGTAVAVREPIDGAQLLRDTRKFLRHFAVWPSEAALTAATLWCAASHARDGQGEPVWEYCSRLLITASDYGSGKSWIAKLIASLCPDGRVLLEPTKPSLIDEIAEHRTIVVTEVDELLATAGRNRGIVAILNASYEPGHFHTRKSGGKTQEIHLFGPMILDGLDSLLQATRPDMRGLVSRCIVLRVRMAQDGYRRPRWDKDAMALAARGRARLSEWVALQVSAGLAEVIPQLPDGMGTPRRCALYEPLFAIALAADQGDADGYWSQAMADAAWELEASLSLAEDDDEATELDRIMAGWDDEEVA